MTTEVRDRERREDAVRRSMWHGCLLLGLALLASAIAPTAGAQSRERQDLLDWYDTLGFPDTSGRPYVRVASGYWSTVDNVEFEVRFVEGFLVAEDASTFEVFLSGLESLEDDVFPEFDAQLARLHVARFVRKDDGAPHERVGYETLDLRAVARDVIDRVRAYDPDGEAWHKISSSRPPARAQIFGFAHALLENNLPDEGDALLDLLEAIPVADSRSGPGDLASALQIGIGDAVVAQLESRAIDGTYSWSELLEEYAAFPARFPASTQVAYARDAADELRRAIAEAAEHSNASIAALSPEEQAREWIYRLRDFRQTFSYWIDGKSYPMMPDRPKDDSEKTPVHRLIDLGDAAVPALLDALDDDTFTRTAVASFNGTQAPRAMRVSDFALGILRFKSGRNERAAYGNGRADNASVRPAYEAWWNSVRSRGELAQLIAATTAGRPDSIQAARKLAQLYPQAALEPIAQAAAATDPGFRAAFVEVAASLPGDLPVPFLRTQLARSDELTVQTRAAWGLLKRGERDVVATMIDAWRNVQTRLRQEPPPPQRIGERLLIRDPYFEIGDLIALLAASGSPEAIDALAAESTGAPVDVRLAVVRRFLPGGKTEGESSTGRSVSPGSLVTLASPADLKAAAGDASPSAIDAAIERLLRGALRDGDERTSMRIQYDGRTLDNPRVCDVAALALAERWPERYAFDLGADRASRDAQIWRQLAASTSN